MPSRWNKFKLAVLCLLLCSFLFPISARAEVDRITVTPALISIELTSHDEIQHKTLTIQNGYDAPISLRAELKGIDDVSGSLVPTDDPDSLLLQNSELSSDLISIPAKGESQLTYSVRNTNSLTPGGHYATLVLTEQADERPEVTYRAALSVAIFVVKRGGDQEHLSVTSFTTNASLVRFVSEASVTFKNDGNVHTQPRGVVSASNGADLLGKGVVNEESRAIFPGKELTDTIPITTIKSSFWPIRYDINLEYRSDNSNDIDRLTASQLYIPLRFIALVLILLMVISITVHQLITKRRKKKKRPAPKQPPSPDNSKGEQIHVRRIKKVIVKSDDG